MSAALLPVPRKQSGRFEAAKLNHRVGRDCSPFDRRAGETFAVIETREFERLGGRHVQAMLVWCLTNVDLDRLLGHGFPRIILSVECNPCSRSPA